MISLTSSLRTEEGLLSTSTVPICFICFLPSFCFSRAYAYGIRHHHHAHSGHVQRTTLDGLTGDDLSADSGLDSDIELLTWDELP